MNVHSLQIKYNRIPIFSYSQSGNMIQVIKTEHVLGMGTASNLKASGICGQPTACLQHNLL